jgi:hypothetical protein
VLVRLPGVTVQALSGPGADSVTALQLLHSGGIRIARYDVATGRLQQILYRGAGKSNSAYDELAVDGSARYLLINEHLGAFSAGSATGNSTSWLFMLPSATTRSLRPPGSAPARPTYLAGARL